MKSNLIYIALILMGILFLSSCSDHEDDNNIYKEINLSAESRATASQIENFYIDFTKDAFKLVDSNCEASTPQSNVVVSPLSASIALGIFANAVDNDIQSKLADYLGVDDIQNLNELSKTLLNALPCVDNKSNVLIASSIYASENYTITDDYSEMVKYYYNVSLQYANFSDTETARANINSQISSTTNNLINNFLPELNSSTYFVLGNAFYFESQWAENYFDASDTRKESFYGFDYRETDDLKDNQVSKVDMMHSKKMNVSYINDDDFEFVSIPFGNKAFSINIFLPNSDLNYSEALDKLNKEKYEDIISKAYEKEIKVNIPKLDIDSMIDIYELMKLACIDIQLSAFNIFYDNIDGVFFLARQGSKFMMDEDGVKVASTTMVNGIASAPQIYVMNINRPFFFFITEKSTNACIIAGRVLGFE